MLSKESSKILNFIKRKGNTTPHEIAQYTKTSKQSVHRHLRILTKLELIIKKGFAPKINYEFNNNQNHNSESLNKFLNENRYIFWDTGLEDLKDLDDTAIVEGVLNYGDWESIKYILSYYGFFQFVEIFNRISSSKRVNLREETLSYFSNFIKFHKNVY